MLDHQRQHVGRRRGFSLVEILVVIGIIALLISILLPALTRARQSATTVVCLSNLRQIGAALNLYANEQYGRLPAWSGIQTHPDGSHPFDAEGLGWSQMLQAAWDQEPDDDIYNCPAFPVGATHNYFISARWLQRQDPRRQSWILANIRNSSAFVLSGDAVNLGFYAQPFGSKPTDDFTDIDKDDATNHMLIFSGEPDGINIHEGRGLTVLFADAHATLESQFDETTMTFDPDELGVRWRDVEP
ncbi:MAG: prepilin-type N-terminal cleavage/methylation domain-containing protein [Planctomycetota bacterium]